MRGNFIEHERVQVEFTEPSLTKQSFAEESEINNILAKYTKTGVLEHVSQYGPKYEDASSFDEFHQAMNIVTNAQQMFADLPAQLRSRFENDPAQFLDFIGDPEGNADEMREMGLIAPGPEPEALVQIPDEPAVDLPEASGEASKGD